MADFPEWSALDTGAVPSLPEHAERPGRIVVVLATGLALENEWALRSALTLARAWGSEGHKVVVADAMLEAPGLHAFLGVTNTEGVTDAVHYGASVRRVAKPSPQGSYFFITAGSPTADAAEVLGSARWQRLCSGFVEAGVALVVFVGENSGGLGPVLESATDVFVLADPDEDPSSLLAGLAAPVHFVGGPEPEPEPEPIVEDDAGAAPLPDAEAEILAGVGEETKGGRGWLVLVLSFIILGIVGAATVDLVTIPGISPSTRRPPPVEVEEGATVATSRPFAETTTRFTHSVTVGAFQDAAVARARAEALAVAGALTAVVPVSIDGTLFHRVVIDPASDEATAEALADRVAAEVGADRSTWVVRASGRGFVLGETADLESAQVRVGVLRDLDVPAYVLALDFVDGSTRFRVYAGAYADDAEAAYLQGHLEERGLGSHSLSDRLGRIPE